MPKKKENSANGNRTEAAGPDANLKASEKEKDDIGGEKENEDQAEETKDPAETNDPTETDDPSVSKD